MTDLTEAFFETLRRVDTPTVCNAIEVAQGRRGFDAFTRRTMQVADPALQPIVGYAKTARIKASAPAAEPPETIKARRMAYYRYMSEPPRPAVVVIEDVDEPDCVGAYWGEINAAVHKGFGLAGAVTNGVMRDLDALAPGFQILAGSVGPSHGFVHVLDFDQPVSVLGMDVAPGALIHADRHGAVCIPDDVVSALPAAIETLMASEKLVLDPAGRPGFDFEAFEKAWQAFEAART
ncbi:RraA family protein [Pelagibius sp.]|uniref:RraA family protein n=1 Tax=Pelagibius sp. TaxID=1931238 RepID=UPI00261D98B8|nr:RraA family protein [Pelagibius sp.]